MTDDTYAAWIQERLTPEMRDKMPEADAKEQADWELRQYEAAEAARNGQLHAQVQENMLEYTTGKTSRERFQIGAQYGAAKEQRDPLAEYGSATRTAVFIDGQELKPREEVRPSQRSGWTSDLGHAVRAARDEFMERELRAYDERQAARPARTIARSQTPAEVECLDCIEDGNVTTDEFLELHCGDNPLPIRTVPDHVPATRKRSGSARTPMIYR